MTADNKRYPKKAKGLAEQERAREQYKQQLWNHRVALIRKGNLLVKNELFGEAVVVYEKYLKILEIIYECGPNGLTPQMLKDSARTTELSVISGIYWDLVRIYDTNNKYLDRQKKAAEKLAMFAAFTPLFPDIMKKAKSFQRQARHPDVIKNLVASAGKTKGRCFIATAAFDSPYALEVQQLRQFRDENLRQENWGRQFIYYYYKYSPLVACFIDKHDYLKAPTRLVLRLVIKCVSRLNNSVSE